MPTTVLIADHDPGRSGSTVSLTFIVEAFVRAGWAVFVDSPKTGADAGAFAPEGAHMVPFRTHAVRSLGMDTVFTNDHPLISIRGITTFMKDLVKFIWGIGHFIRSILMTRPHIMYVNEHTLVSASVAAWLMRVPSVMHVRSRMLDGTLGIRRRLLSALILRSNAKIFGITGREVAQLTAGDRHAGKTIVVPEFVPPKDAVHSRSGSSHVVLMLGGVQRVKGSLVFLRAAEQLLQTRDDTEFVLAGSVHAEGDARERQHHSDCMRSIANLEARGRLTVLGSVPDPSSLYAAASIVIIPSTETHFSRPLIEAWSWGKPVIVSATAHHSDLVREGQDAVVVPIGDHVTLAENIGHLLDHPETCARLGEAGQARSRSEFDADVNTLIIVSACERIVRGS